LDLAIGGGDRFDAERRCGTLVTSPLRADSSRGQRPLHRLGVLFVADDRRGVLELDRRFRNRFER
jgi:hypothetical protein